jgi:hypothetical protein
MSNVLNLRLQSKALIHKLEEDAVRFECDPRQLAVALLSIVVKTGLIDSVLDGDSPKLFAPHYSTKKPRGVRGGRQTIFLEWVKDRLAGERETAFSYGLASRELGWTEADIGRVARSLMRRGEIVCTRSGKRNHPSTWSIVDDRQMENAA